MLTQLEKIHIEKKETSLFVIILKQKKEFQILGCECCKWVCDAVKKHSYIVLEDDGKEIADIAREYSTLADYTLVLKGNIPLLTSATINHLLEYCFYKRVNACKFMGGALYNTQYLKSNNNIFYDSVYSQNDEDFYVVENAKQLHYANETMRNRIIQFHIDNGVVIDNPKNVIIEKWVDIEKNVVVSAGNVIKGYSLIKEGVILKENNVIQNSKIGEGSCVASSTIENSEIGQDTIVMPYCNINKCQIGNNVLIMSNMNLINKKIKDNRKIKANEG